MTTTDLESPVFRRFLLIPLVLAPLAACGQVTGAAATPEPGASSSAATATKVIPAAKTQPASGHGSAGSAQAGGTTTAALTGTHHAFLTAVDPAKHTITFDLVDWFEGAAAKSACKQDGVTETANDWCVGYYYRNNSHKLRTLHVKSGAPLRVIDMSHGPVHLVTADLGKFQTSLKANGGLFVFTVTNGDITKADEVYQP
ncbi:MULTISPECIES: hypothetical protein [unclassified Actinoplanes]|uniref:hypothetical protein n=1 Tax=unclassified Actinoplanes TaxID=2626549 RepID=UPI0012BAC309|nr:MULTISPECIES: hypothetical protein [unclassified Actinoplanes]